MHPAHGVRTTRFVVAFTLREAAGHQGVVATEYGVRVLAPAHRRAACTPPQPMAVRSGARGTRRRVRLPHPRVGWCHGRYRVTVFLQRGPYCPPPQPGEPPEACPKFATRELDTGSTSFRVRRHGG